VPVRVRATSGGEGGGAACFVEGGWEA
jgi:hypothetical protein